MNPEESEYYRTVASLFSVPLIGQVSGNRLRSDFVYLDTRTGAPMLYHWDGESRVLTPEPVTGSAVLHPSYPWVAFAKDEKGTENYALYLLDYSKNEKKKISDPMGRLYGLFWASDQLIVFGCDQKEYYIKRVSLDGSAQPIYVTDQQILTADYTNGFLAASVGRGPGTKIAVIEGEKMEKIRWISESDQSEDLFPRIYPGKYVAYITDVAGILEIVVRSLDLEEIARVCIPGDIGILPGEGDITWVDQDTLFAAVAKDGQVSPRLLKVKEGVWSDPLAEISVFSSAYTKDGLVWVGTSFSQPPSLQVYRNGKVTTLVQSEFKGASPSVESHWYSSFDGRKIQGWLLRTSVPGAPLVVYCHGGPNFANLNMWDPEIGTLVQAGHNVFAPNFRGSTTFGSEFRNLNIGDIGGGDLNDVLYGAHYARKVLNVGKPAIVGASYGGYLVLQALTTQPEEWAGGVSMVPWADIPETYEMVDAHYRALFIYLLGGTPEEKKDLYRDRSPITHLGKLKSPVLIIQGENDSRCPLKPVEKFYKKARELNLPVELEVIKEEGHGAVQLLNAIKCEVLQLEYLKKIFSR